MKYSILTSGQYSSSNSKFSGSKKEVLKELRFIAAEKRRDSRKLRNLPDSVHSIDRSCHPSELVTIASFHLNNYGIDKILELLNAHGVLKYKVVPE